jgi:hypothetical protein
VLPGLFLSELPVVIRFDFGIEAEEGTLGRGFIAQEIGEALIHVVSPAMGVAWELVFDFVEAVDGAFQEPVRTGELTNKRGGDFVITGRVVVEPTIDERIEFGGVFIAEDGFLRTEAVFEIHRAVEKENQPLPDGRGSDRVLRVAELRGRWQAR